MVNLYNEHIVKILQVYLKFQFHWMSKWEYFENFSKYYFKTWLYILNSSGYLLMDNSVLKINNQTFYKLNLNISI